MADGNYTFAINGKDNASDDVERVNREMRQMEDAGDDAARGMRKLERSSGKAGGSVLKLGDLVKGELIADGLAALPGFALEAGRALVSMGAQGVRALTELSSKTAANALQTQRMASATGASAESIQELTFAFQKMGADTKDVNDVLGTLAERAFDAQQGAQGVTDDFSSLNITIEELRGKSPDELLNLVSQRIVEMEDPTRRLKGAVSLLGDEMGNRLVNHLSDGGQGLESLRAEAHATNQILSEEQVQAASDAGRSVEELTERWGAFKSTVGADLAPALETFADALNEVLKRAEGSTAIKGATDEVSDLAAAYRLADEETREWTGALGEQKGLLQTGGELALSYGRTLAAGFTLGASEAAIDLTQGVDAATDSLAEQQRQVEKNRQAFEEFATTLDDETRRSFEAMNAEFEATSRALANQKRQVDDFVISYSASQQKVQEILGQMSETQLSQGLAAALGGGDISIDTSDLGGTGGGPTDAERRRRAREARQRRLARMQLDAESKRLDFALRIQKARERGDEMQALDVERQQAIAQTEAEIAQLKAKQLSDEERKQRVANVRKSLQMELRELYAQQTELLVEQASEEEVIARRAERRAASIERTEEAARRLMDAQSSQRSGGLAFFPTDLGDRTESELSDLARDPALNGEQRSRVGRARQQEREGDDRRSAAIQTAAAGQAFGQASQMINSQNEQLRQQLQLYGQLQGVTGDLASQIAELADEQWNFESATSAATGAADALAQVGGVAAKVLGDTVAEQAGIKAAFEAASATAMLAAGIGTGNPQFFASATQHGIAAGLFGSIAGAAAGGAISNTPGGQGGAGGGAGAGAATTSQNRNIEAEREKMAQAFADKLAAQQSVVINQIVDFGRSTHVGQTTPQVRRELRQGAEEDAQTILRGGR